MSDIVLSAKGVGKSIADRQLLREFDLELTRGDAIGLVGRDAGVTQTLFRLLLGVERPDTGSIEVLGLDPVAKPNKVLAQLGYVPPQPDAPAWMRPKDYFDFSALHYVDWNEDLVEEICAAWTLPMDRRLRDLTAARVLEVQLLAALAYEPKLLIIDFSTRDAQSLLRRDAVVETMQGFRADGGAILCAPGNSRAVESVCQRTLAIANGRLQEQEEQREEEVEEEVTPE